MPMALWENQNALKALYAQCVETVCRAYDLTRMELDVLLFLANNPSLDTATDIVETRHLTKSHVSQAIQSLERRGYLSRLYRPGNRKTAHLQLNDSAKPIIESGRAQQAQFQAILFRGVSEADCAALRRLIAHVLANVRSALKEE